MFAVIKHGGKQYIVTPGQRLKLEKNNHDAGESVELKDVLLMSDGKEVKIGSPLVGEAVVRGKVLNNGRAKKVTISYYHSKNRYHKTIGHRQPFSEIEIEEIKL